MKILVVCGMGLGSSHYLLMEVISIIKELGIKDADVDNCDLFTAQNIDADVFIGADYIINMIDGEGIKIKLDDILDKDELRDKLKELEV